MFYSINGGYLNGSFGADVGSPVWKVFRMTSFTQTNAHYLLIDYTGAGSSTMANYSAAFNNSALTLTSTTGNNGSVENRIGSYVDSTIHGFDGWISEWLLYNKVLDAGERTSLAAYMSSKYGL